MNRLEVWGGIECTINRVGDQYYRQLEFSGHEVRPADLHAVAALGIKTLRYPVLWEQVAPDGLDRADWRWPDERIALLKELQITPIVGLLHHGSGPKYTSLIDEHFPQHFAEYALAVAQRYPWVKHYTPINEPLTTARFSGLYGLWYPHGRSDRDFVRALLNQCRATVLAMRAIRRVNPQAQLVQTDDLGKVYSTRHLAYQANFENHRRWLTWDLLCGRVDRTHVMRRNLVECGATDGELDWLVANPCPPDIIGINHYLTSDRYLHQEADWIPRERWGGNGREAYADTEAVRVLAEPGIDLGSLIQETWERYKIPIAITEAHLGCSREEQMRWLLEVWQQAQRAQSNGVDIRAVTAWSLFGSFDWNSLLTQFVGHYEPSAFDIRSPSPRPTAVARLIHSLAAESSLQQTKLSETMPFLETPGWWRRPSRLLQGCAGVANGPMISVPKRKSARPILITGARGTLGAAFARICAHRGIEYKSCLRTELDIAQPAAIDAVLDELHPWAVINTAGYVRVDEAERDRDQCFRENLHGAEALAAACSDRKLPLLTFSSDLVFDGESVRPYVESQVAHPLNVYGMSKAQAEQAVLRAHPGALVIRTSAFFGPWDEHNFLTVMLRTLKRGDRFTAIDDITISPTYVPDLVHASLDLFVDGECGVWHLTNQGALSWADLARQFATLANIDGDRILAVGWRSLGLVAPRPRYSALSSERGLLMPTLDNALERYFNELAA